MALTITVIRKDLKVYIRQKKTLMLIFLAPILIMILIGSVFSGSSEKSLKEVRLGAGGGSELGDEMVEGLNSSGMFVIIKVNTTDPAVIEEGVRKGEYSAGIFIPENQTQSIRLYIDNSRLQIAPVISSVFLTITEKLSYELTLRFVSKLWEDLGQMESELLPLKESILSVNRSISELSSNTDKVMASLEGVNITELNRSLRSMNRSVEQMRIDLNRSAGDINITRKELGSLDSNITAISDNSTELRDQLRLVVDSIDSADRSLLEVQRSMQDTFNTVCSDPGTVQCVSVGNAIRQIQETRALIQDRGRNVKSLHSDLENVALTSTQLHEKLNQTDTRLKNMEESINNYTLEMSNIRDNVSALENTVSILGKVKEQSAVISTQINELSRDVANRTPILMADIDRTRSILGEVLKKSPAAVASPIKLERESVFGGRSYLDFLIPKIIAIVLMFISFLLASITIVQERSKKTLVRTLMTPLSLVEFILAKTSALVLIALMQGIILIIVAYAFYGVVVPFSQWGQVFLVILVYSASFIGIGMALATFSESENTAMLSSLVLTIPMLFMGGIFFPFETMPPLMAGIGGALPITIGIRALDSVLIYTGGFDALAGYLLPLMGYGAAGIGTAYILLKREVED